MEGKKNYLPPHPQLDPFVAPQVDKPQLFPAQQPPCEGQPCPWVQVSGLWSTETSSLPIEAVAIPIIAKKPTNIETITNVFMFTLSSFVS